MDLKTKHVQVGFGLSTVLEAPAFARSANRFVETLHNSQESFKLRFTTGMGIGVRGGWGGK